MGKASSSKAKAKGKAKSGVKKDTVSKADETSKAIAQRNAEVRAKRCKKERFKDFDDEAMFHKLDEDQMSCWDHMMSLYENHQRLSDGQLLVLRTKYGAGVSCTVLKTSVTWRLKLMNPL